MSRIPFRLILVLGLLGAGLGASPGRPIHATDAGPAITEFPVSRDIAPHDIAAGPDGNLWFTDPNSSQIGRLTPSGGLAEFPLPTPHPGAHGIIAGPDGSVWFIEGYKNQIGRMTMAGAVTEFPLGQPSRRAYTMAVGPDGVLWVGGESYLWRLTPAGALTTIRLDQSVYVDTMTVDRNGTLFMGVHNFMGASLPQIGRFPPNGAPTWTHLGIFQGEISALQAASDGALWFTVQNLQEIGRLMLDRTVEFFPLSFYPRDLMRAADGTFWIAGDDYDSKTGLWQLTAAGQLRPIAAPAASVSTTRLAQTRDGAIWFAEPEQYKIGRLVPTAFPASVGRMMGPLLFLATQRSVFGAFRVYWEAHGGLALQGYPITDQFTEASALDGKSYTVQYFERAVLEYHPENHPPYDVLLSQLGTYRYQQKYPHDAPGQQRNTTNPRAFPQTGHAVGGSFRTYWEAHGGLAQFGYPLTEEFSETSALNGTSYTVQYFERAVFEFHPENAAPYTVLLSQLGTYRYQERYPKGPPP